MKQIKLVIWDLDETFWGGTLSEEGITKSDKNIEVVIELTRRGIVNSIVSKNNFEDAKKKLTELGVWEYFIFPKIEWSPKGPLVSEIIDQCNLRAENVIFIDDNHLNIEEVKYYNPKINCDLPEVISTMLSHPAFKGKDDSSLSRLKQYKVLEKKVKAKSEYSDNIEFLKESEIKVDISKAELKHLSRIHELVERTNQLNFTKIRSNQETIKKLLSNHQQVNYIIQVQDRFGDYGIVGFVSINKDKCLHFVFSCRVLNLGVEQFIYEYLNKPKIQIVEPVSSGLTDYTNIDWIELRIEKQTETILKNKPEILIKGGCDLLQSGHYLEKHFQLTYELNSISESIPVRVEHTSLLSLNNKEIDTIIQLDIPFIRDFEKTTFFQSRNIVYSILMDCDQYLYEYQNLHIPLSFDFATDLEGSIKTLQDKNINISEEDINRFIEKLTFVGKMNDSILKTNLNKLQKKLRKDCNLTIIGASSNYLKLTSSIESKRIESLNEVAKIFCRDNNYNFIDINLLLDDKRYFRDSYKHYTRRGYEKIASAINEIYSKNKLKKDFRIDLNLELKHFYRKVRLLFK